MRSSETIKKIIVDYANADDRVRAVLLNGSRANSKVEPDPHQDFDIVFIVTTVDPFIANPDWIAVFGERLILQRPGDMCFGNEKESPSYSYLMLFRDGNRIDLTLFPVNRFQSLYRKDSLTIPWIDKDHLFAGIEPPDDKDYHIKIPSQKLFSDTCNEFWWVSVYVAKGLLRKQLLYTKEMLETVVRKMLLNMTEWYIGTETGFTVSAGQHGKFLDKWLSPGLYQKLLSTYPDHETKNIWNSLFAMTALFAHLATEVSGRLGFTYNREEETNITGHLKSLYDQQGLTG